MIQKLAPDPLKKSKHTLDQQSNVLHGLSLLYIQVQSYRSILELRCKPVASTSYRAILKNKKGSGTPMPVSFSKWFYNKKFSVIFY